MAFLPQPPGGRLENNSYRRRAFGWPEAAPVPRIELEATARHFGMDASRWARVCERSRTFYIRTAYVRYDPSERLDLSARYDRAAHDFAAGRPLQGPGLPSLDMPISLLRRAKSPTAAATPSTVQAGPWP